MFYSFILYLLLFISCSHYCRLRTLAHTPCSTGCQHCCSDWNQRGRLSVASGAAVKAARTYRGRPNRGVYNPYWTVFSGVHNYYNYCYYFFPLSTPGFFLICFALIDIISLLPQDCHGFAVWVFELETQAFFRRVATHSIVKVCAVAILLAWVIW